MPLQTASGRWTTLAAHTGRSVMIADFMTLCEDICPLITANTVQLARALQADGDGGKVALLEITLDPTRDTPPGSAPTSTCTGRHRPTGRCCAPAQRTRRRCGSTSAATTTGSPKGNRPTSTGKPLTYDIDHSDDLIFLDAAGRERFVVDGSPDTQGRRPPKKLAAFLGRQGRRNLDHPSRALDWTVGQAMTVFSWLTGRHLRPPG